MKTLTAPDKTGELLRAGKVLDITGNALLQWVGNGGALQGPIKIVSSKKMGPFPTDVQFIITALPENCNYQIIDHTNDISPMEDTRFPTGVVPGVMSNYVSLANCIRRTIAGVSNTRILVCGDSRAAGETDIDTNAISRSFLVRLAELLNNGLCAAGWQSHYGTSNRNDNGNGASVAMTYSDARITNIGSGWSAFDQGTGICGSVINNASTIFGLCNFAPTVVTDTIDVFYIDGGAGYDPFNIKLQDGTIIGSAAPNGVANGLPSGTSIKKATGLASLGSNVYVPAARAGSGSNAIIVGWECYDSSKKQILLSNAGIGGTYVDSWLAKNPSQAWHALRALTDPSSAVKFDAVILDYGTNHWLGYPAKTPDDFYIKTLLAVDKLRTANIPVIIHIPGPSAKVTKPIEFQRLFVDKLYLIAKAYGLLVVDSFSAWGSHENAFSNDWMSTSVNPHESVTGYALKAQYFFNAIEYLLQH
ncbi:hypothetical protein ACH50O_11630 [Methylomonas sp. 2BW1-5-20]|uniref:hypothetical protein n=1 Tax=Methylomonas sp. 2BW1-5-20 TaxID=3376686 RepID=UPI00404FEEB8